MLKNNLLIRLSIIAIYFLLNSRGLDTSRYALSMTKWAIRVVWILRYANASLSMTSGGFFAQYDGLIGVGSLARA